MGSCPDPVHELLTYLVDRHGLLLHGSNHLALETLEPQPAQDLDTALLAVVAATASGRSSTPWSRAIASKAS